jgi:hypothetical protein
MLHCTKYTDSSVVGDSPALSLADVVKEKKKDANQPLHRSLLRR